MGCFRINNFLLSYRNLLISHKQRNAKKKNSFPSMHFAQLELNLLHRIWDFTPGWLNVNAFRCLQNCTLREIKQHFHPSRKPSQKKKQQHQNIFMRLKKLIHAILMSFIIGTSINYWENKNSIKMNSSRYRHILIAHELRPFQQICYYELWNIFHQPRILMGINRRSASMMKS